MGHIDISNNSVALSDPVKDQALFNSWEVEFFQDFPVTNKPIQFGYQIDIMDFKGRIVVRGGADNKTLSECERFDLLSMAFDCEQETLLAYVSFSEDADIHIDQGAGDKGQVRFGSEIWTYRLRQLGGNTPSNSQLVLQRDNQNFIIYQGPTEKISMESLMDFF